MSQLARRMVVVGVLVAIVSGAGTAMWATHATRTTADEPHYLLTATSIGEDLSLDVSDERAALRYVPYHQLGLLLQEEVRADGTLVSPHDPLLPAILALPMIAGGWIAAKLALSIVAGAVGAATVWLAVRRFGVSLPTASPAALLAGTSPPLAVYGTQVYPEIVAALVVLVALGAATGRLERRAVCLGGAAVVALPWLNIKYAPLAMVIAGVVLVRLIREGRFRTVAALGATFVAAAVLFGLLHRIWYGGLTAYASGSHFVNGELGVIGRDPDYLSRTVRLSALLTDRTFGLVVWQPALVLVLPAVGAIVRRPPVNGRALLAVLAAGWATATWLALTMHGFWWPGRQTVAVLPLAVIVIALWVDGHPWRRRIAAVLGAIGSATYAWIVVEASTRRLGLATDPESTTAPTAVAIRRLFVDYTQSGSATSIHHLVVAAGCLAAIAFGMRAATALT